MAAETKPLSMAAGAIALRGVTLFLNAKKAAQERKAQAAAKVKPPKPPKVATKLLAKTLDTLLKVTKFNKQELESLYSMYRKLVSAGQQAVPPIMGQPQQAARVDGIDVGTFRDVMHTTLDLVTEEAVLERIWMTWERPAGGEGAIKFEAWARGLSIMLKGTDEERMKFCFAVYDLNADGYITKDEMFVLLKNSLLKQPGDEDPDEGVRDLVELVLKKMDIDKDGRVSPEDYTLSVQQEPLLLEAFGQCLPTKRHAATFLKTLTLIKH